jgi:hypothetical protein
MLHFGIGCRIFCFCSPPDLIPVSRRVLGLDEGKLYSEERRRETLEFG